MIFIIEHILLQNKWHRWKYCKRVTVIFFFNGGPVVSMFSSLLKSSVAQTATDLTDPGKSLFRGRLAAQLSPTYYSVQNQINKTKKKPVLDQTSLYKSRVPAASVSFLTLILILNSFTFISKK